MLQRVRELVQRDFEREGSGGFARRALEGRRADVELDQPVRGDAFGKAYSMRDTIADGSTKSSICEVCEITS